MCPGLVAEVWLSPALKHHPSHTWDHQALHRHIPHAGNKTDTAGGFLCLHANSQSHLTVGWDNMGLNAKREQYDR